MKALKWFVIESDTEWNWMHFTAYETWKEASQAANHFWEYVRHSPLDRKHRRIEVAELWAVWDEDDKKWNPMYEVDEGFDRDLMEGKWIGSYTPSFTIGPDDR